MSWFRRNTARRGRLGVALGAALAFGAIGAAVVSAPASAVPAAELAARTAVGTDNGATAPAFLLEHGKFLPIPLPRDLDRASSGQIGPIGINDHDQIVGSYDDSAGGERGFLLDLHRNTFSKVDVPGAKGTQAQGINNTGQIVGVYSDASNPSVTGAQLRGFLLDHGRYVRLDFPGSVTSQAFDVNNHGQVVGEYQAPDGTFHGYLWEHGKFRGLPTGTATGINDHGQITGNTAGPDGLLLGYQLKGSQLTTFRVGGAGATLPFGINDRGQIVGISLPSLTATTGSGFLRSGGQITTINKPGAVFSVPFGINDRGQIVGVGPTAEDLANQQGTAMIP